MSAAPLSADARVRAADLYERFAPAVEARLARRYYGVDPQLLADAAVGAVLACPADLPDPLRWLCEHARQLLRVRLRGNGRRRKREEIFSADRVTAGRAAAPSPADEVEARELADGFRDRVARTDLERAALGHWLNGVTDPGELADRLGLADRAAGVTLLARLRQRLHREKARAAEEHPP